MEDEKKEKFMYRCQFCQKIYKTKGHFKLHPTYECQICHIGVCDTTKLAHSNTTGSVGLRHEDFSKKRFPAEMITQDDLDQRIGNESDWFTLFKNWGRK